MGIIRLTLIAAVLIWLSMLYFGRDEGLPEDRIGRDAPVEPSPPATETVPAVTEPDPAPPSRVAETPAPPPPAAPAPEADPTPAGDATPARTTITTIPLEDAVDDAVGDVLAPLDPAPTPDLVTSDPEPSPQPIEPEAPGSEFVVLTEEVPDPVLFVTGSRVNVRSGPSTVYGAITSLPRGTAVDDLGDAGEGWRMIRLPAGGIGYMSGDFLSPVAP